MICRDLLFDYFIEAFSTRWPNLLINLPPPGPDFRESGHAGENTSGFYRRLPRRCPDWKSVNS
jgi:hypothetical protein